MKRRKQVMVLHRELGLRLDCARGAVTKIKHKKIIS